MLKLYVLDIELILLRKWNLWLGDTGDFFIPEIGRKLVEISEQNFSPWLKIINK